MHYFVVHDEIGFKADELQNLTNVVSYMFARATKAVSLVSPWASGPGVGGSGTNGTGAAIVRKGGLGGKHDMVSAVNTPLFIPSFHFASLMYLQ
jgi:hypothetical protein